MQAKKKENRAIHWALYTVYRFYNSPFFLIGQIIIVTFFVLNAFIAPFVVNDALNEIPIIQNGIYTRARIVGEPIPANRCCNDFYHYQLAFYRVDGQEAEATITVPKSSMDEHREGDTVWISYAESNPAYVQLGEPTNTIQDWAMGLATVLTILLFTGYFVIGSILVKIYYPKPKIKVTEAI